MGHYGCTAFLLSSGSFHHILNQTGQWPLTTALTLLLTFCNQFKSLVGARLYKARSRAFPNFRWTALDIWISTSEKMNQLLQYFLPICLNKKTRHCPSKEVHPWKIPLSALKNSMFWNIRILYICLYNARCVLGGGGSWIYHPVGCWCLQSAKWNRWTGASCQDGGYRWLWSIDHIC